MGDLQLQEQVHITLHATVGEGTLQGREAHMHLRLTNRLPVPSGREHVRVVSPGHLALPQNSRVTSDQSLKLCKVPFIYLPNRVNNPVLLLRWPNEMLSAHEQ